MASELLIPNSPIMKSFVQKRNAGSKKDEKKKKINPTIPAENCHPDFSRGRENVSVRILVATTLGDERETGPPYLHPLIRSRIRTNIEKQTMSPGDKWKFAIR